MSKILIAGDFVPLDRVKEQIESGNYSCFEEVKPIVQSADYSIINFESPVVEHDAIPIVKYGPNLKCSAKGLEAVKWAGFSCVTLANNHFLDYGGIGVVDTLDKSRSIGIDIVGGGKNLEEAAAVLYKYVGGQRLAIINVCENEFSIASPDSPGSNPLDPVRQYYTIQEAKNNADRVLVIVHGGHELFQLPSPRMVSTYRYFIDVGADAVVNHHQHCYSGYEVYKGKPIFYGLGNFCFDHKGQRNSIWNEGYMVTIDFSSKVASFTIHPYRQCDAYPRVKMLPTDAFDEKIKELNCIIEQPAALAAAVNTYYEKCGDSYSNIFEPIRNRYYLTAKHRGWLPSLISKNRKLNAQNYILCEAHRDKLMHWLKK